MFGKTAKRVTARKRLSIIVFYFDLTVRDKDEREPNRKRKAEESSVGAIRKAPRLGLRGGRLKQMSKQGKGVTESLWRPIVR